MTPSGGPDEATQRVSKILAARGVCSRREAERLIDAGCVLVNGDVVRQQGAKAAEDARIEISGAGAALLGGRSTVLLNKPIGVVSTQPEPGQRPAWTLIRAATLRGSVEPAALMADCTSWPAASMSRPRLNCRVIWLRP